MVYFPHFYKRENIVYFFRGDATFSMDDVSRVLVSVPLIRIVHKSNWEKEKIEANP